MFLVLQEASWEDGVRDGRHPGYRQGDRYAGGSGRCQHSDSRQDCGAAPQVTWHHLLSRQGM